MEARPEPGHRAALRPLDAEESPGTVGFSRSGGIIRAFRDHLHGQGFTEIHTPKIVRAGAEGGSNVFRLDYFGRKAFWPSPPILQADDGGGLRAVRGGPRLPRAEKHSTARHLNEYTSLDLEMGYIDSFYDIMDMETGFLKHCFRLLRTEYAADLGRLGGCTAELEEIPCVRFDEAKRRAAERYGYQIRDPYDLEPEEEHHSGCTPKRRGQRLCVRHPLPRQKRPFYAMDDPEDPRYTSPSTCSTRGSRSPPAGRASTTTPPRWRRWSGWGCAGGVREPPDGSQYGLPPHGGLGLARAADQ